MFEYSGSKSVFNRAKVKQIIIEQDNTTIAFEEGYEEDGVFVPVGADHIILKDQDHLDFLKEFDKAEDKFEPAKTAVPVMKAAMKAEELAKSSLSKAAPMEEALTP
jgi:hypothetical protein